MMEEQGTVLCAARAETDRQACTGPLREAGFTVIEAETGKEVLSLLAAEKPALIFLAGPLDDLDTAEACRRIKSGPSTRAIPVLLLLNESPTARGSALALECGADDFLSRPIEPGELIARCRALLQARQAQPAIFQRSGLTKSEAEELMDWLENNGYPPPQTAHIEGRGFIVRWEGRPADDCCPSRGGLLRVLGRIVFSLWDRDSKRR